MSETRVQTVLLGVGCALLVSCAALLSALVVVEPQSAPKPQPFLSFLPDDKDLFQKIDDLVKRGYIIHGIHYGKHQGTLDIYYVYGVHY